MKVDIKDVVISSRVRLARNITHMPIKGLTDKQADKILSLATDAMSGLYHYKLYEISKLTNKRRESFVEQHIISRDLADNTDNGSLLLDEEDGISVMVCEEDHIRAQCLLKGLELMRAYELINAFDNKLIRSGRVAYDKEFGFLTGCITNVGTGMRASVMVFLPALTLAGKMQTILDEAKSSGVEIRGVYGEGSNADGYLYQISNKFSIGMSELDIIRFVDRVCVKICNQEMSLRKEIYDAVPYNLKDRIMRAYGILTNAHLLSSAEFKKLAAEIRIGISLGLIECVSVDLLDKIDKIIMPASLSLYLGKDLSDETESIARAELVRKALLKY